MASEKPSECETLVPSAVVIFNFKNFDDCQLEQRAGSIHDVKRLKRVFYAMDLPVFFVNDPSLQKFYSAIEMLSQYDFTNYASLQLVYMSHGDEYNVIYCKDGQFDFLNESIKLFQNPTLRGKPKYIIVQACKGSIDTNWKYNMDSKSPRNYDCSEITAVLTSSFEGFVAYLGETGSRFIKTFEEVMQKYWNKEPYSVVLNRVMAKFNAESDDQIATLHSFQCSDTFSLKDFPTKQNSIEREFTM